VTDPESSHLPIEMRTTYGYRFHATSVFGVLLLSAACGKPQLMSMGSGGSGGQDAATIAGLPRWEGGVAQPGDGPIMACAGERHKADIVPVDLMLLMDSSGSMDSGVNLSSTRWENAQLAVSAFIRDPASAGLGVGLQFFPYVPALQKPCNTDQDCADIAGYCRARAACPGADPVTPGRSCRQNSPGCGADCRPIGACSTTGALCANVGDACPGGGTCVAFPRSCWSTQSLDCDDATYETPAMAIASLPGAQEPLLARLYSYFPWGGTPMGPAVRGTLAHLRAHLQANPTHKAALVLVTDGIPVGCQHNDLSDVAIQLNGAFTGSPSIVTHVVGIFTKADPEMARAKLDLLAQVGGSKKALVLEPNSNLTQTLQEGLNQIRGVLACDYRIPPPPDGKTIDFGKVNLHYTGEGTSEDIPYVERAERCDPMRGGWYYDVPPALGTPTRVLTCESTCRRFRSSQTGNVELVVGCATVVIQ
jgi:hypothetical protein